MKQIVSQSFFAHYIGVGRSAVSMAIDAGRLSQSVVVTETGRRMLDLDRACQQWDENTDRYQSERARMPRPRR
jgi:hypothetical protein